MFAVFRHFSDVSWNDFPETFRFSPFFTLDEEVNLFVCSGTVEEPPRDEDTWEDVCNKSDTECLCEQESNPPASLRNVSALCRERLASITSHT